MVFQCAAFHIKKAIVIKEDHAKEVVFVFIGNGKRNLRAPVEFLLIGEKGFLAMVIQCIIKSCFVRFIPGNRCNKISLIVVDMGHIFRGNDLGIGYVKKISVA